MGGRHNSISPRAANGSEPALRGSLCVILSQSFLACSGLCDKCHMCNSCAGHKNYNSFSIESYSSPPRCRVPREARLLIQLCPLALFKCPQSDISLHTFPPQSLSPPPIRVYPKRAVPVLVHRTFTALSQLVFRQRAARGREFPISINLH